MDIEQREFSRKVKLTTAKGRTSGRTPCAVRGAICFVKADPHDFFRGLAKMLRFREPASFMGGLDVYGLDAAQRLTLERDAGLRDAIAQLFAHGASTVRIADRSAHVEFVGRTLSDREGQDVIAALEALASSIEALTPGKLNDEAGHGGLSITVILASFSPTLFLLLLAVANYRLHFIDDASTLWMRSIAVIASFAGLFALYVTLLRRSALGGVRAFLKGAALLAIAAAWPLGYGVIPGLDMMLGQTFRADQMFIVHGLPKFVRKTDRHGRPTVTCSIEFYRPRPAMIFGIALDHIASACSDVDEKYAYEPPHAYELTVNPGFFGVPFVESVRYMDESAD